MRVLLLLALAMQILVWPAHAQQAAGQIVLAQARSVDLLPAATLFKDDGGSFPASAAALPAWSAPLRPAAGIDPMGGAYWLVAAVRNDTNITAWVLDPNNTMIERVEARLLGADGSVQQLHTGFRAQHDYLLHYGKDLTLAPHAHYQLVLRFSSPYYVRAPIISMLPAAQFRSLVART
jgi:hypothetical protein